MPVIDKTLVCKLNLHNVHNLFVVAVHKVAIYSML